MGLTEEVTMPNAPGSGPLALFALSLLALTACASGGARPVETVPVSAESPAAASPANRPAVELDRPDPPDHTAAMDLATESNPLVLHEVEGEATFYADYFDGRRTASGTIFRQNQMTAAHREFPFGTVVRVTNLRNDRSVTVRITDRGPFGERAKARNRIIDLSRRAADALGFIRAGWTPVRVEVLEWGEGR